MGCIIKMTSDTFLDKFIKENDYKKFNFLLVSENIKTENKYKNVYVLKSLIPPPNVLTEFITNGKTDKYVKKYADYLQTSKPATMIAVAVKLAAIENSDVVLICTKEESEYKYLDILCDFIENVYNIKICSYKKYKKDLKSYDLVPNKKKIAKIIKKQIESAQDKKSPSRSYLDKDALKSKLKDLSKKELHYVCKEHSIDYDKNMSKKDLIKIILTCY